ncbi:hypothetical protein L1987_35313 [Smallanthus sonchifolius]|uniref:Uncharacterized protein n=1 Tax=Smallanthus sonchifolius TaxID=185202 RepID=A0ACB9HYX5_9ASTR|nr:hypothetical protein L1987_35313 [Smallanthus sonchifolius]
MAMLRSRRRSWWDPPPADGDADPNGSKKRKSRWADDEPKPSGQQLDDRPEGARSPSPDPVYDNMGTKFAIRGKGTVKEVRFGQKRDLKFDPSGGTLPEGVTKQSTSLRRRPDLKLLSFILG